MRICIVTNRPAWPPVAGHRLRGAQTLRALAGLGEVDVVLALPDHHEQPLPPDARLNEVNEVRVRRRSAPQTLTTWIRSDQPLSAVRIEWGDAVQTVQAQFHKHAYDVVWLTPSNGWTALACGRVLFGSSAKLVVDFDDLEDQKLEHAIAAEPRIPKRPIDAFFGVQNRVDLRRWRRIQAEIAAQADAVILCSELDVGRFAQGRAFAIPNGYPQPATRRTEADRSTDPPYVLFVGDLGYRPNGDAARWLVDEIMPKVWERQPDMRLRLVGGGPAELVTSLARDPRVELRGRVPAIEPEVRGATATLAPLTWGGGTRLKVLEGFAHGVPVVSTTVGAEGLRGIDGLHLAIGDDAPTFAAAICSLATSAAERDRLTGAAATLYEAHFTQSAVAAAVERVIAAVTSTSASARR